MENITVPNSNLVVEEAKTHSNMNAVLFAQWSLLAVFIVSLLFPIVTTTKQSDNPLTIGFLLMGWLAIFIGNISWYWIIPTFLYFKSLKRGMFQSLASYKRIIYFAIPFLGLLQWFYLFSIGQKTPGDIEGGAGGSIVVSYATGFYLYAIMIAYVVLLMSISNTINDPKKCDASFNVLTALFLLVSLGTIFLTF